MRALRRHEARAGQVALLALLVAALATLLLAASAHAVPGNSDGATVVVEGAAMRHGNVLLAGWRLSLDSFWVVDVPLYALGVLVLGVRPVLLNLVPALIATATVVLGARMAADGRCGRARLFGIGAVVALLGLPSHALAVFFLQGPLHVGTALSCLVAFFLLRQERGGWRWAAAVAVLAAGILGDAQTLVLGVAPVLGAGLLAVRDRRRWQAGAGRMSAAVASVALALAVRWVAVALGSFGIERTGAFASSGEVLTNLRLLPTEFASLLGVGTHGLGTGGVPTALGFVHLAGLVLVTTAILAGTVRLVAGLLGRRVGVAPLDDLLALATLADLAFFVLFARAPGVAYARYLTAAVVFSSVLAGRLVARCASPRALGSRARRRPTLGRLGALAGIGVLGCVAASVGLNLAQPLPRRPEAGVARFLVAHHLHRGIGDYWSASVLTVESRDKVKVRPVLAAAGSLESYPRNSEVRWYTRGKFRFLLYRPSLSFGGVDACSATATYGPPARRYQLDGYVVLVWPHPVRVPLVTGATDRVATCGGRTPHAGS